MATLFRHVDAPGDVGEVQRALDLPVSAPTVPSIQRVKATLPGTQEQIYHDQLQSQIRMAEAPVQAIDMPPSQPVQRTQIPSVSDAETPVSTASRQVILQPLPPSSLPIPPEVTVPPSPIQSSSSPESSTQVQRSPAPIKSEPAQANIDVPEASKPKTEEDDPVWRRLEKIVRLHRKKAENEGANHAKGSRYYLKQVFKAGYELSQPETKYAAKRGGGKELL
jgi:hypothetical protein